MGYRVSRGDAEAVFKAGHAGVVAMGHAGIVRGAPADIDVRAAIRPYANTQGVELDTERTAIRRMPEQPEGFEEAEGFYFQQGKIVGPGKLSVGSHTLAYTAISPTDSDESQITFTIDPPGTGACI